MKSLKINKIICYVLLVIASIGLGVAVYAGIGVASQMNSTNSYAEEFESNMYYVLDQIMYTQEYVQMQSDYELDALEGYMSLKDLESVYETEGYELLDTYWDIEEFAYALSEASDYYIDADSYYYEDDNRVYIYRFYSELSGENFSYEFSEGETITEEEKLEIISELVNFEEKIYISEQSLESGLDAVINECVFYIDMLEKLYYFEDEYGISDGELSSDFDPNFFYYVKVSSESTGEETIYHNEYNADMNYAQHISASVTATGYDIGEIVGFEGNHSSIENVLMYNLHSLEWVCEEYGVIIEVDYAVDTSWESGSWLAKYYSSMDGINPEKYLVYIFPAAIILLAVFIITFIILTVSAGHNYKKDAPTTIKADRLYLILWLLAGGIAVIALSAIGYGIYFYIVNYGNTPTDVFSNMIGDDCVMFAYITGVILILFHVCFIVYLSVVRRIKTKTLLKTTLIGAICRGIKNIVRKAGLCAAKIIENKKASINTFIFAGVFYLVNAVGVILMIMFTYEYCIELVIFTLLLWIIINIAITFFIWKYMKEFDMIEDATKQISSGNQHYKLTARFIYPSNRRVAENINNIGDGISKAVEASMKNERMKTDLITNVSHDIKTPLTSIINYIKLLKDENIDNENAVKYINVLDEKAERLKVLTDDLVEASKLSSGTIELTMSDINIVELINQATGEFKEKFAARGLQVITDIGEEQIIVHCDGKKIWRVLDNLYGNVCKYALPGTRVYVDVECGDMVYISVKNISESRLNFDASELTERFVRGDMSRNTEGSGLGLSIAKSIAERHGGALEIVLDGDLFKVIVKLPAK